MLDSPSCASASSDHSDCCFKCAYRESLQCHPLLVSPSKMEVEKSECQQPEYGEVVWDWMPNKGRCNEIPPNPPCSSSLARLGVIARSPRPKQSGSLLYGIASSSTPRNDTWMFIYHLEVSVRLWLWWTTSDAVCSLNAVSIAAGRIRLPHQSRSARG